MGFTCSTKSVYGKCAKFFFAQIAEGKNLYGKLMSLWINWRKILNCVPKEAQYKCLVYIRLILETEYL
jgi:hypothetical protein